MRFGAYIDSRLARQAVNKSIETETEGWEPDSEEPDHENKGGLSRMRLADKDQIVVTRIAELLKETSVETVSGIKPASSESANSSLSLAPSPFRARLLQSNDEPLLRTGSP